MAAGMLENVIKQMVNKFPDTSADNLMARMKGQPQAAPLFQMMKTIGISEDKLKKMIDDQITSRQKK